MLRNGAQARRRVLILVILERGGLAHGDERITLLSSFAFVIFTRALADSSR
jgi:hypothetical protein